MKTKKLAITMILALSVASLGAEAFAVGPGGGGLRKRDGSCVRTSIQTSQQVRNRTATKTSLQKGTAKGAAMKGTAQGQKRRLGPGDGTGNVTRPLDGTGYGSPATAPTTTK